MENIFQNLGNLNLNTLFESVKQLQGKMQKMRQELEEKTVEGRSGGDMIRVMVSGNFEIKDIKISPEIVDKNEIEMLQDLIIAAINDGIRKAKEMIQNEMSKLTVGINIPGLNLNQFM